jgi:hypothetical protein
MENFEQTIASQYANSPTLAQMIDSMNQFFDPAVDFQAFFDYVWNVDTAQGFGLDIWGAIVNVSRNLTVPNTDLEVFGFEQGDGEPFGQAPFYKGQPTTMTYTLDDTSYRKLILVKALSNISICSAPSINQQLRNLFPSRGKCYVNDFYDMTMRLTFEFELESFEIAILTQSNAITRPAAVEVIVLSDLSERFGFLQGDGEPFNQGTFYTTTR